MTCPFCRNNRSICASYPDCSPCPPLCPPPPKNLNGDAQLWTKKTLAWIRDDVYGGQLRLNAEEQARLEEQIFQLANQSDSMSDFDLYSKLGEIVKKFDLKEVHLEVLTNAKDLLIDVADSPDVLHNRFDLANQIATGLHDLGLKGDAAKVYQVEVLPLVPNITNDPLTQFNLVRQTANELSALGFKVQALNLHQETLNHVIALPDTKEKLQLWGQMIIESSTIAYSMKRIRKTDLKSNLKTGEGLIQLAEKLSQ